MRSGEIGMRDELHNFLDQSNTFEVRGLRLLLEYFFANDRFRKFYNGDVLGVSVFGSARVKETSPIYQDAVRIGNLLYRAGFAVITGASSGVMEGANRGVAEAILERIRREHGIASADEIVRLEHYIDEIEKYSVGLKITLPFESDANPYLGSVVSFHYFAIRKFYFAMLARAFIRMKGGFGTRDEFWEILTLVQTGKAPLMPIVVLGDRAMEEDVKQSIAEGYVSSLDLNLIDFVDTPEEAVAVITGFYKNVRSIEYSRRYEISIKMRGEITGSLKTAVESYRAENPEVFQTVIFQSDRIVLGGFGFQSFGHLRKIVNLLNLP